MATAIATVVPTTTTINNNNTHTTTSSKRRAATSNDENQTQNHNQHSESERPSSTKSRKSAKTELNGTALSSSPYTQTREPGEIDGCPLAVECLYGDRHNQPLFVLSTDEPKLQAQCFKHILDVKFIKSGKIRMTMYKTENTGPSHLNGWVMRLTCMNSLQNGGAALEMMPLAWNRAVCKRPLAITFPVMRIKQAMEFQKQFGNAPVRLTWVLTQTFENIIYAENLNTGKYIADRFFCSEEASIEEEFNPMEFHVTLTEQGMNPRRNKMYVSDFVKTISAMHERRSDDNLMVMKWAEDSLQFICNTGSVNIPCAGLNRPNHAKLEAEEHAEQDGEENQQNANVSDDPLNAKFNISTLNDLCDLFIKDVKDLGGSEIANVSHFINMSLFSEAALILRQTLAVTAPSQQDDDSENSRRVQFPIVRIAAVQSVKLENE